MIPVSRPASVQTTPDGAAPRTVTVVQHAADIPLDRLTDWWSGLLTLRVVRPDLGEPLPATLEEVGDGLVVLGGEVSAYDDEAWPWLPATRALMAAAAQGGVPTLGICLGAQLLAVAGGGQVAVAAPPGTEAGTVLLHWRPEARADALLGSLVERFPTGTLRQPTMHGDAVVEVPKGAVWLASSDMYPFQAFRWGSAWGVQFHPEASPELVGRWAAGAPDVDADQVRTALEQADDQVQAGGRLLAEAFATIVTDRAALRDEAAR